MFQFLTRRRGNSAMSAPIPTTFHFTASSRNSGWTLLLENGRLTYRETFPPLSLFPTPGEKRDEFLLRIEPNPQQWSQFHEHVTQIDPWRWRGDYAWDYGIQMMGGQRWELALGYDLDSMRCSGNNRQTTIPSDFLTFLLAVSELCEDRAPGVIQLLEFLQDHPD